MAWARRVAALFRRWRDRQQVEEDLDAEIQAHFEILIERYVAKGSSLEEARRAARLEFGGREHVKQTVREARVGASIEASLRDVRYAWRVLRKSPGFTTAAILTMALGIGANTAVFSIVNAVLLRPLPYSRPDRIVQLETLWDEAPPISPYLSLPKIKAFRAQTQIFQDVAIYDPGSARVNLTGGDRPEQLASMRVSAEYFPLFAAPVALGRTFTADEDSPRGPRVAVISNGLWRSRYGGDPGLIGKSVDLGGAPCEVIGVLGPDFHWDRSVDIWLPLQANPDSMNHLHNFLASARLAPGVSFEQAGAAVKVASEGFRKRFPPEQSFFGRGLVIERMQDVMVRDIRPALRLLLGSVGLVLLIACVNVANLLLARASVRQREIAVRSAMGAGRSQIIRQLLIESAILSLAGGVLGLLLGYFGLHALLLMNPGNIPRIGESGAAVTVDGRILLFTVVVTALAGLLFGLIPAVHASRADITITLKESDARLGGAVRQNRARWTLVAAEVALAVVLLVGSALMMRTYLALRAVKPGFDPSGVLTMDMSLDGPGFLKTAAVAELVRNGTKAVKSLAGVEAAATTSSLPLEQGYTQTFMIEGRPLADNPYHGMACWIFISPRYFDVFRIPIVQGRAFTDHDDASRPLVIAISEAMARQFWPNGTPVGQRISLGKGLGANFEEPPREIVGIVGDVRDEGLNSTPGPTMYVPVAQLSDTSTALNSRTYPLMWIARTRSAPFSFSPNMQRELLRASGGLPAGHVRSMRQVVLESIARNDFNATLFAIFAGMALLLAAIGIYGVVGYSVQQRTHEIGIRMAMGAQRGELQRMVAASGMKLVLIGLGCGIAGALALTRLLSSLLFGVRPTDVGTFGVVTIGLLGVGAVACYIPARRATRVDPMVALRHE